MISESQRRIAKRSRAVLPRIGEQFQTMVKDDLYSTDPCSLKKTYEVIGYYKSTSDCYGGCWAWLAKLRLISTERVCPAWWVR